MKLTKFLKIAVAFILALTPAPGKLPADGKEIIPAALLQDDAITAAKIASNAVETAKIKDSNVTLAKLAAGITPAYVIKYAGEYTWSGGGASCAETVTGALASDILLVTVQTAPTEAVTLKSAAVTENTVTTTLSGANTSNDAVIAYVVLRAAS